MRYPIHFPKTLAKHFYGSANPFASLLRLLLLPKVRTIKLSVLLITTLLSVAKLQAQPDLENTVPPAYKAAKGTLSISSNHYRLGSQSLKWEWKAGDTLIIDLNEEEEAYVNANLNVWAYSHFEMWVHNEVAGKDTFDVKFINYEGDDQFKFRFNANFEGWRRLLRSYKYDMIKIRNNYHAPAWNVDKFYVIAPLKGSGSIFLDNVQYMRPTQRKHSDRVMPDLHQLANSNTSLLSSDFRYTLDTITPLVAAVPATSSQLSELNIIRARIRSRGLELDGGSPTPTEITNANTKYQNFDIQYNNDVIRGRVVIEPQDFSDIFYVYIRDFVYNNSSNSKTKAINLLKLMLDNGIAGGSSTWFAGGSSGYADRDFYKALINAESFIDEQLKYKLWDWLKWSTDINLGWHPNSNGLFNTDNLHVLFNAFNCIVLLSPSDNHAIQSLHLLKRYLDKFLAIQKGDSDGLKPDGTGFHHNAHYNSYMYGFGTVISSLLPILNGTSFNISQQSYQSLVKVVYAQALMSNKIEYSNSTSGRHPFDNIIAFYSRDYTNLAITGGSLSGRPYDATVAAMQKRLYTGNPLFSETEAEPFPTGFWQMNYSPLALFRKDNWCTTIKGINKYFWGTESTEARNRYGRYQSYGAVEVMYEGGLAASGFAESGWDWTKIPGTTSISLPFSTLGSSLIVHEYNQLGFAGGVKFETPKEKTASDKILRDLHGNYGMFGLMFQQSAASSNHDPSFVFRKSYFCFDDKILCLGSNINNANSSPTITTLYQNSLSSASSPSVINGSNSTGLSVSEVLAGSSDHWLIDAYKTGYYILKGNSISVKRGSQTTPNDSGSGATATGNFATAYIDHGRSPSSAKYAYVMVPNTTIGNMNSLAQDMKDAVQQPFKIIQQDSAAHIVEENATAVYGFSFFLKNSNLNNNPFVKANDVPCITMMRKSKDTLRISLVNPDLNLVDNESTAIPINLTLHGTWAKIPGAENKNATVISSEQNETIIEFVSSDGMPASIILIHSSDLVLPIYNLALSGTTDPVSLQNTLTTSIETNEDVIAYLERTTQPSGTNWTELNKQPVYKTNTLQKFVFVDKDIVSGLTYYYRVKSLEASGEWKYSNVLTLKGRTALQTSVYPNPASSYFTVTLKNKPTGIISWFISDGSGKKVNQGVFSNQQERIKVANLATGYYILNLSNGDSHPIIINK